MSPETLTEALRRAAGDLTRLRMPFTVVGGLAVSLRPVEAVRERLDLIRARGFDREPALEAKLDALLADATL